MKTKPLVVTIPLLAIMTSACLVSDTTHTLYLSPDGSVVWRVVEADVRSNEHCADKREAEERTFLADVAAEAHPMATALLTLRPDGVWTEWLRRERPYTVATEGRFDAVDRLARELLMNLGLRGESVLERNGDERTLRVTVDLREPEREGDERILPLAGEIEDLRRYRIVLTDGRFTAATGFEIVDEDVAVPLVVDREKVLGEGGELVIALTWRR